MEKKVEHLGGKIFTGVFWNVFQLVVNRSFGFLIKLVLARILVPEQFGVVGMAMVFISFIEVFNDIGIGAALIQRKETLLTPAHYHTAFWTGVGWSVFVYLIIVFFGGPLAATFYNQPILTEIVPILSLGVLSSPVNLVHKAQLTRAMDFKKIALINNASVITAGTLSLILAFLGYGIWALVFNSVATFIVAMPLYFRATKWLPVFVWQKQAFKDIFGFGAYTTGTKLFNNFSNQIDYLLIGKLMSSAALGAYTLAFVLTDTLKSQVMQVLNNVMYPVYGKKQDDPASLKRYYLQLIRYNSMVVYPIMVGFIVLGQPIISVLFGSKWQDTVIPLKILSLSVIFAMMTNSVSALIRGMGFASLEFKIQAFKALFLYVPLIYIGIYYYGLIGASVAILINKVFFVIISQLVLNRLIGITYRELFSSLREVLFAALVAFLISFLLYEILHLHFIIVAVVLMSVYCGVILLTMKNELKALLGMFKKQI